MHIMAGAIIWHRSPCEKALWYILREGSLIWLELICIFARVHIFPLMKQYIHSWWGSLFYSWIHSLPCVKLRTTGDKQNKNILRSMVVLTIYCQSHAGPWHLRTPYLLHIYRQTVVLSALISMLICFKGGGVCWNIYKWVFVWALEITFHCLCHNK